MKPRRAALGALAGALIAASVLAGVLAIATRAGGAGDDAIRVFEALTLFLAAAAYLAYAFAHHSELRALFTRSILVSAFALWGIVQIAPGFSGAALLNDVTILLFVADLAILLSPWA